MAIKVANSGAVKLMAVISASGTKLSAVKKDIMAMALRKPRKANSLIRLVRILAMPPCRNQGTRNSNPKAHRKKAISNGWTSPAISLTMTWLPVNSAEAIRAKKTAWKRRGIPLI